MALAEGYENLARLIDNPAPTPTTSAQEKGEA
jgi:hypothetical protein